LYNQGALFLHLAWNHDSFFLTNKQMKSCLLIIFIDKEEVKFGLSDTNKRNTKTTEMKAATRNNQN